MDYSHIDEEQEQHSATVSIISRFLEAFVRVAGIILLVIGLVLGFMVMQEAWLLYREPVKIERFVVAIEQGSNLDKVFSPFTPASTQAPPADSQGLSTYDAIEETPTPSPATPNGLAEFRLAYFPAWFIVIVLMLLIGRLAIAAVKTGGELALYNVLTKKTLKGLLREIRR